jgi:lysophospholipid acyltransferase (LPLAT)-like uncharacterized protein
MKLVQPWTIPPFAFVLSAGIRWWISSSRLKWTVEDPAGDPHHNGSHGIYLFWHEMLLFPAASRGLADVAVLVSRHRDGELITRILKRLGMSVVRGSTTRQGLSALRALMRQGQQSNLAITPDGPLGPRRVVQSGALYVASRTGMPIYPTGFSFHKCWRVGSWDRMAIPKLLSSGVGVVGKPIIVPPDLAAEGIEEYRVHVQAEMDRVQERAEVEARNGT